MPIHATSLSYSSWIKAFLKILQQIDAKDLNVAIRHGIVHEHHKHAFEVFVELLEDSSYIGCIHPDWTAAHIKKPGFVHVNIVRRELFPPSVPLLPTGLFFTKFPLAGRGRQRPSHRSLRVDSILVAGNSVAARSSLR